MNSDAIVDNLRLWSNSFELWQPLVMNFLQLYHILDRRLLLTNIWISLPCVHTVAIVYNCMSHYDLYPSG